jgi:hypothetical protein
MRANDAPEGSRVTVVADLALNDYEAFRRGDLFHIKLPSADFAAQSGVHGKGFENVQVQKSGDGVILSFKLQPGTTARVDQRFNRLDVVFTAVGSASATTQEPFPNAKPGFTTESNSQAAGRDSRSRTDEKSESARASSEPPAVASSGASESGTTPTSQTQASTKVAPGGNSDSKNTSNAQSGRPLILRWLQEDWIITFIPAILMLALLVFMVLRVRSRQRKVESRSKPKPKPRSEREVKPDRFVENTYSTRVSALWDSPIEVFEVGDMDQPLELESTTPQERASVDDTAPVEEPVLAEELNLAEETVPVEEPVPADEMSPAQEEHHIESPTKEDFSEVTSLIEDDHTPNTPEPFDRADFEIKKILSGREYDPAVIDSRDAATRHVVSAALLAALAGRNVEQHAHARQALMDHGYFDEITNDLRTATTEEQRAEAARRLGIIGDSLCTPHLVAALCDGSAVVRRAAVESLGQTGDPSAITALNDLLSNETSPQVPEKLIEDSIIALEAFERKVETTPAEKPTLRVVERSVEKQQVRPEDEAFAQFLDRLRKREESELVDVVEAATDEVLSVAPPVSAQLSDDEIRLHREEEALLLALKELEHKRKEAETARKKAEMDARLKAETEARARAEIEARLRTEEEARRRAEEEAARRKAEEEARVRAEQQARMQAEEEARLRAEDEVRFRVEAETLRKAAEELAKKRAAAASARKLAEEEARKRAEEEARQRAEEEARRRAEEEARQRAELEARQRAEEGARQRAEEEARRRVEEEAFELAAAEARRLAEEQARVRDEEEARSRMEEETRRRAEEEARMRAEDEAQRRAEEAERARAAEEAERRAEDERKLQEAENQRNLEEQRLIAEQEALLKAAAEVARRRAEIEEARRKAEEEAQNLLAVEERIRQEEEERHRIEEERQRVEAEAHRRAEEERRRLEEIQRQVAEEQRQFEEQARLQAEEQSRRLEELEAARQRVEEESRQRTEQEERIRAEIEALHRAEQEQRERIEAETRRRSEAEARLREEEARRELEEQARIRAEAEAQRLAEETRRAEEARVRAEEETRQRLEEEARRRAEDESRSKSEEEARVWAEAETRRRAEAEAKLKAEQEAQEQLLRDGAAEAHYQAKVSASSASDIPLEVLNRLKSASSHDRIVALNEVLSFGGDEAFRLISEAFDDEAPDVQNAAARALYELQSDRAASFTRALREGSPERRRRIGAALAASGLASEAIGNLTGESREKTYDAFSLLFLMAKAGEVQPLMHAIEDYPNVEARLAVVKLLALSGQAEIVPAFRRLAVRGSLPSEVRSAVMEAIYQISSQTRETAPSAA